MFFFSIFEAFIRVAFQPISRDADNDGKMNKCWSIGYLLPLSSPGNCKLTEANKTIFVSRENYSRQIGLPRLL